MNATEYLWGIARLGVIIWASMSVGLVVMFVTLWCMCRRELRMLRHLRFPSGSGGRGDC